MKPIEIIITTMLVALFFFLLRYISKMFDSQNKTVKTEPIVTGSGGGGGGSGGGGSSTPTTNGITIISELLAPIFAGTNNVIATLTAPTLDNCVDTNNRTLIATASGVTVKKNGVAMLPDASFTATDTITVSLASNIMINNTENEVIHQNFVLFTYKAIGVCGDSNIAEIKTTLKVAGTVPQLPSFTIQDAYLDGATYIPYASLVDAMDKNFDESGFTNRNATLYASAMDTNQIAYSNAIGTVLFPEGNYFYGEEFKYLSINAQGVMFLFSDITKPALTPININSGFN